MDSLLSCKAEAPGPIPGLAPYPQPCRRNKFAQMQEFNLIPSSGRYLAGEHLQG